MFDLRLSYGIHILYFGFRMGFLIFSSRHTLKTALREAIGREPYGSSSFVS